MKNKTLTYILLIIVAFIWYKVFFRVKNNLAGNNIEIVQPITSARNYSHVQRDTFDLNTDYRDPFSQKRSLNSSNSMNNETNNELTQSFVEWPTILYFGLIKKVDSKNPLAIISIDGYKHSIRENEVLYDGLKVISIERDQVILKYKTERKTFLR